MIGETLNSSQTVIDTEMINNFSQAIATILAVFLGAVLTFITTFISEHRSKKQKMNEQIREHQLQSVKKLVHIMQHNTLVFHFLIDYNKQIKTKLDNTSSPAQRANIINNYDLQINNIITELKKNQEMSLDEIWELKFLKYGLEELIILEKYINKVTIIVDFLSSTSVYDFDENFINTILEIDILFEKYINGGKNGLSR